MPTWCVSGGRHDAPRAAGGGGPGLARPENASEQSLDVTDKRTRPERSPRGLVTTKLIVAIRLRTCPEERAPVGHTRKQRRGTDQRVVPAEQVRSRTAPRILFRWR